MQVISRCVLLGQFKVFTCWTLASKNCTVLTRHRLP